MKEDIILLDVSRLIWRRWSKRLPTGIDRVCLAYLRQFSGRARAVVQYRRFRWILDRESSRDLFDILLGQSPSIRIRLAWCLARASLGGEKASEGQIYFNVGHTGLNSPSLGSWLEKRAIRPVFLIHDLIPITHPQYCREGESERHSDRILQALRLAAGLISNSNATRRDLAAFATSRRLPMPPTVVSWLGLDHLPAGSKSKGAPAPIDRPYFMLIGTIEARKNHLTILRAWSMLVDRWGKDAPLLIIVGQRGWKAERAIEMLDEAGALGPHILELGRCADADLGELIAGARAVLMPSFVEGFGLPVAEALRVGTPVISSDLDVFREIASDIPEYLDPDDVTSWVDAIERYSTDGANRRLQLQRHGEFRPPSWEGHFQAVEKFVASLSTPAELKA